MENDNIDNTNSSTNSELKDKSSIVTKSKKTPLFVLLVVILVATSACVTYVLEHKKYTNEVATVTKLNDELTSTNKEISNINSELNSTKAKYQQLSNELNGSSNIADQASLTLTVNNAARYSPDVGSQDKNIGVAVDITLKNATSSTISIITGNFKLKDSQSNTYEAIDVATQGASNQQYLPSSYVALVNQTLAPGQSVKGALEFSVNNTALNSFTLVNGSKTYSVST